MAKKDSSQPERREYYRIEESILMAYSILDSNDESNLVDKADSSYEILSEFANVSTQMKTTLGRISERSADVASCLKSLDTKINLLAQVILVNGEEQNLSRHDINISAGGLAFNTNESLDTDILLKIKLILPPDLSILILKGKVVSCIRQDNFQYPYQVSIEFTNLSDTDQDTIARHIMRLQAQQLRQRKENLR